jgi:small subunit ribosomal protein S27Ae
MAEEAKPAPKVEKKKEKAGKKPHVNKPTSKKYSHYTISGTTAKKAKTCPRCGQGTFLAQHKDRVHCGKCNYTEFTKN